MKNITRVVVGASAATLFFAGTVLPAFAAGTPDQQSCFGQGRSAYAVANPGGVGVAASARQGDNAAMNAAYRDACQGA